MWAFRHQIPCRSRWPSRAIHRGQRAMGVAGFGGADEMGGRRCRDAAHAMVRGNVNSLVMRGPICRHDRSASSATHAVGRQHP